MGGTKPSLVLATGKRIIGVIRKGINSNCGKEVISMPDSVQWTMNCVLFGAGLFKKLSQGQLKKEDAIAEVKNLSSELTDEFADYLLKRIQDLVTG